MSTIETGKAVVGTVNAALGAANKFLDALDKFGEAKSKGLYDRQSAEFDAEVNDTLYTLFGEISDTQRDHMWELLRHNAPFVNRIVREYVEEMQKGPIEEKADALRNAALARIDPDVEASVASLYFEKVAELRDHEVHALLLVHRHQSIRFQHSRETSGMVFFVRSPTRADGATAKDDQIAGPIKWDAQWRRHHDCLSELARRHPELVKRGEHEASLIESFTVTPLGARLVEAMLRYQIETTKRPSTE